MYNQGAERLIKVTDTRTSRVVWVHANQNSKASVWKISFFTNATDNHHQEFAKFTRRSGQIFERTKTCTHPAFFLFTAPGEPCKFSYELL